MKSNRSRKRTRLASLLLALALTLLCFGAFPVWAEDSVEASMYPVSDDTTTGVILNCDVTEETWKQGDKTDIYHQANNNMVVRWYQGSGISQLMDLTFDHHQELIRYTSPTTKEGDDSQQIQTGTIYIVFKQSFNTNPPIPKGTATKIVLGAKVNRDKDVEVRLSTSSSGSSGPFYDKETNPVKKISLHRSDSIQEYVIPGSLWSDWGTQSNLGVLRIDIPGGDYGLFEMKIAYVRLVDDSYKGLVSGEKDGSQAITDYPLENNLVDFTFTEDVELDNPEVTDVLINGRPVRNVIASTTFKSGEGNVAATDPDKRNLRVDLGTLHKGTTYTVSFPGIKTAEGGTVKDFTFSTQAASPVENDVTIHKAAVPTDGVAGGWEGSNSATATWSNWGWINIAHDQNTEAERMQIQHNSPTDKKDVGSRTAVMKMNSAIDTGSGTKLVIGLRASEDFTFSLYAGKDKANLFTGTSYNLGVQGGDAFREYVFKVKEHVGAAWDTKKSTGFGYLRMDTTNGNSERKPLTADVAYVRLADDTYNGPFGAGSGEAITPGEFSDTFDVQENAVFDLVFEKDVDVEEISRENITWNGQPAASVMIDPNNKKQVRVSMKGVMQPMTRGVLKVSGLYDAASDAPMQEKEFRFTTQPADDQAGEHPVFSSFDLVTGYQTSAEAAVTPETALGGKTVTAVLGGLYNNTDGPKKYMLALACYDQNGVLQKVAMENYELCGYETLSESGTLSTTEPPQKEKKPTCVSLEDIPSEAKTVRAFLWNQDTLEPLTATK